MIGRDRDVEDVLLMHGWSAKGVIRNDSDARISGLEHTYRGLTGLSSNYRVCYHVLVE